MQQVCSALSYVLKENEHKKKKKEKTKITTKEISQNLLSTS